MVCSDSCVDNMGIQPTTATIHSMLIYVVYSKVLGESSTARLTFSVVIHCSQQYETVFFFFFDLSKKKKKRDCSNVDHNQATPLQCTIIFANIVLVLKSMECLPLQPQIHNIGVCVYDFKWQRGLWSTWVVLFPFIFKRSIPSYVQEKKMIKNVLIN